MSARPSPQRRGEWQIVWSDGPTIGTMRQYAADLGRAVAGVDLDHLTWSRASRSTPTDVSRVIPRAMTG
ncbi:hypothetical protein E0H73_37740 [Kribbella pittospori]|uniref:Uncharacterized protein n=1 Tax=Kribbella pittospori TaxID=722689 RepID=A0A4R0K7P7_9ACTN|nr:hypothetical protein [Kribbella pittospori]TCC54944.1 hypothetical protein E0H73_37740 [Kribbella pittospori]